MKDFSAFPKTSISSYRFQADSTRNIYDRRITYIFQVQRVIHKASN